MNTLPAIVASVLTKVNETSPLASVTPVAIASPPVEDTEPTFTFALEPDHCLPMMNFTVTPAAGTPLPAVTW